MVSGGTVTILAFTVSILNRGRTTHHSVSGVSFIVAQNSNFYLDCAVPPTLDSRKEIDSHGIN
jgi:hypothetical protein